MPTGKVSYRQGKVCEQAYLQLRSVFERVPLTGRTGCSQRVIYR